MLERTTAVSGVLAGSVYGRQIALEEECRNAGVRRYRQKAMEAIERHEGAGLPAVNRLTQHWFPALVEAVKVEQRASLDGEYGPDRNLVSPIICSIHPDIVAAIAIREVLNACLHAGSAGVKTWKLRSQIGRAVIAQVNAEKLKELRGNKLRSLKRGLKQGRDAKAINRWAKKSLKDPVVGMRFSIAVGNKLLGIVMDTCWLPTEDGHMVPAFIETQDSTQRRACWTHLSTPALACIEQLHREREAIHPRREPMLHEPSPWVQTEDGQIKGGYTTDRTPYILKSTKGQRERLKKANLALPNAGRTAVERNPWKFNRRVWEVAEKLLADGTAPGLPQTSDIPFPPRLTEEQNTEENRKKRRQENAIIHKQNAALHSARSMYYEQAAVVRRFLNEERVWNPHAFDFRQRLVPIPPYLNHMGGDFCRGLLETGWDNPVTDEAGFNELLVHAANCYGVDKVSREDRIAWSMANMSQIIECATDPLSTDFWHKADKGEKPWQFLAACFAIQDPQGAGGRLPVQFDGSANVLQHYAGMTLDPSIAEAVNLIPLPSPNDPYNAVAGTTRALVDADAESMALARILSPFVDRNLTKRPYMVRLYSATPWGLKGYIRQSLIDTGHSFAPDVLKAASKYLHTKLEEAASGAFPAAEQTMGWLRDCAKLIVKKDRPVAWDTLIGFPVEQPYRERRRVDVHTATGTVYGWVTNDEDMPLDRRKHVSAVAPNFVHSIDSTHMLLTAIECAARTIWFAPVHDCFWTHANTAAEMNVILRDKFIEMHRNDLLNFTLEQWRGMHRDIEFPEPPARGDFDLELVRGAVYSFA